MKRSYYDELIIWRVEKAWGVATQISRAPRDIRGKFEVWKDLVESQGPDPVSEMLGFEARTGNGQWEGSFFVSFGFLWKLRYCVRPEIREVLVLELESEYERQLNWEAELLRRERGA